MAKKASLYWISMLVFFISQSCQKIDLGDEETTNEQENAITTKNIITGFEGTGKGTLTSPLTVYDIRTGNIPQNISKVWLIGYAVGATKTALSNAEFNDSTTYSTSILLANDSMCTDISLCVPVELNTTKLKTQFAIPYNRKALHKCIIIEGTPKTYYNTNGLRNISEGHWLYGFDISYIKPIPEEWEERELN